MKPFSRSIALVTAVLSALLVTAATVGAQATPPVRLRGRGDAEHDRFLKSVFASTDQLMITRDTVIARNDTVRTRVVVVGATLRLDGVILGDLVGVGGNLFVRPSATVAGSTRNIAGGLYPSQLATLSGHVENSPNAQYEVVRSDSIITVVGLVNPSLLHLPGIMGFEIPTYDRVSGVTLRAGAELVLPRIGEAEPFLRGWGTYYSQRGDFGGGADVALRRGWTEIAAGAERTTLTNERWVRKDLSNSLSMLFQGKDYRNYYAADRAFISVDRTLEKSRRLTTLTLTGQVEQASPLRAARPWSFKKPKADTIRPNYYGLTNAGVPRNPDGRITSGIVSIASEWERPKYVMDGNALVEVAGKVINGDHAFARLAVGGDFAMEALKHHTLQMEWHFQTPLPGTDSLPYQRWTFIGGSGTLHTFPVAAFTGDRVAFVETKYTIPLPVALTLPLVGRPELDFIHLIGMAWTKGDERSWEQNVGARLAYRVIYVRALTNPRHFSDDVKFSVGVNLPRKAFPWQRKATAPADTL
ncbi:MAG: hypothetical protein ABIV28_06890 [Longimicrobiales bacterium]